MNSPREGGNAARRNALQVARTAPFTRVVGRSISAVEQRRTGLAGSLDGGLCCRLSGKTRRATHVKLRGSWRYGQAGDCNKCCSRDLSCYGGDINKVVRQIQRETTER